MSFLLGAFFCAPAALDARIVARGPGNHRPAAWSVRACRHRPHSAVETTSPQARARPLSLASRSACSMRFHWQPTLATRSPPSTATTAKSGRVVGSSVFLFTPIIKGTIIYPAPWTNLVLSFGWIFLVVAAVVLMIKSENFREYCRAHSVEAIFLVPYLWCLFTYNYPYLGAREFCALCNSDSAICVAGALPLDPKRPPRTLESWNYCSGAGGRLGSGGGECCAAASPKRQIIASRET